jgi:hypothetical protein
MKKLGPDIEHLPFNLRIKKTGTHRVHVYVDVFRPIHRSFRVKTFRSMKESHAYISDVTHYKKDIMPIV